jgi:hypothetical protein
MTPVPPQIHESPESASPIVSRAVAAGLAGHYHETLQLDRWQRWALQFLGFFPPGLARFVLSRAQAFTALDSAQLAGLSVESLAQARVDDYAGLKGAHPTIVVGAALGGAAANLALSLGGPFLPQAFVLTLKGGSIDGNPTTYLGRSADLARKVAGQNPDVITIQHYDPVHDGWITKRANHLRLKLIGMPRVYADFLRERLQPGGAVCYLECGAAWPRYRIEERSFFQIGGWGGLAPQEYLEGSPRLRQYCQAEGLKVCDWRLTGFPLEVGPESEWGSEPGLGEALEEFCRKEGYEFVRIQLPGPFEYAKLAFSAISQLLKEEDREPSGVLIEMFSQFDSTAARRGGLLPLWLVFNTGDSLEFLREMRPEFPEGLPVFFSALSTFSLTPDIVPWSAWEHTLEGMNWYNIGSRPSHYPSDIHALLNWNKPLRQWVEKHGRPIQARLTAGQLQSLALQITSDHSML